MAKTSTTHDPTMYKKLLDEEGDLMFHDEEEQQGGEQKKKVTNSSYTLVNARAVAVPARYSGCCSLSCWCKCVLITLTVFILMGFAVTGAAYFWMKDVVEHLTITDPTSYPVVDMTDAQLDVVKDRVKLFVDQLRAGEDVCDELVVTQDEINGFIGHSDYLRGNMMVTLDEGKITEEYSLPTDMLPGGKGRYYVGEDYFKFLDVGSEKRVEFEMETAATHEDWFKGPLIFANLQYLVHKDHGGLRMLELYMKKGSFFGNVVPQDFIDKHVDLLDDFNHDPDNMDAIEIIDRIERVTVTKGKITVSPRCSDEGLLAVEEQEEEPAILMLPEEGDEEEEASSSDEELTVTETVNAIPATSNLRKSDTAEKKQEDESSYTFAKKIDGNVGAHHMHHHNHNDHNMRHGHHHKHHNKWNKSSSSSSSSSSDE